MNYLIQPSGTIHLAEPGATTTLCHRPIMPNARQGADTDNGLAADCGQCKHNLQTKKAPR